MGGTQVSDDGECSAGWPRGRSQPSSRPKYEYLLFNPTPIVLTGSYLLPGGWVDREKVVRADRATDPLDETMSSVDSARVGWMTLTHKSRA